MISPRAGNEPEVLVGDYSPLTFDQAISLIPATFRGLFRASDTPSQLLMSHSFEWRSRLVISLAVIVGFPFLLASLLARDELVLAVLFGLLAIMFVVILNVRTDVLIDLSIRTITRKQSSFHVIPLGSRTWTVRPDMEIKAFVRDDDGGTPVVHEVSLVDGRHRLPLTPPHYSSAEESLEIVKFGNALAEILGVPFTGYAKRWRFYWP